MRLSVQAALWVVVSRHHPLTYNYLYHSIAEQENSLPLTEAEAKAPFAFRVKNQFAKEKLAWQPSFAEYSGLHSNLINA